MKKLLIAVIAFVTVTSVFAAPPAGGKPAPGGNPGRGPAPSPRVQRHDPGPRKPQGGFEWTMFGLGVTRDILGILNPPPPPQPRVIVRESPRVIVTTPAPVVTTPTVVKEVVEVEKPVIVEKTKTIKTIEPVIVSDKIYFKVTYTDGTIDLIQQK